ncbi:MAG: hypothetical protein K6B71_02250 [Alphaproteobacteria bacterium]|nr:hypothetical protein [Alphaproteobacteria bacterium]
MKGFKLFFVLCLGLLAFQAPGATDSDDTVRAAVRRDAVNSTSTQKSRQKSLSKPPVSTTTKSSGTTRGITGRTTAVREKTNSSQSSSRTTVQNRAPLTNTGSSGRNTTTRVISDRNAGQQTVTSRVAKSTAATRKTTARTAIPTRTAGRLTGGKSATRVSRAATIDTGAIMANYSHCREVYTQCMDEFCANKDAQLKRCACSSRVNEFDGVKKQLAKVEDKMLDFNQRLLTVNMDAEDVEAMMTATEGENAFYETEDKTKSKKMLDEISKKLNKAFDSDEGSLGMGAISLSLDTDSIFDSVDSFMGSETTTKTGTALYAAARPVCREMALEICSEEEFSIIESSYQMQIEQDCNTVAKAYQTQTDQARTRVFESNALLDISRLDTYQKRNSDDVLTCKKKMLDMLSDTTICGTDLGKCLDTSGKYIDPTTGNAFLTQDLSELSGLLTRPESNQKWSTVPSNNTFVTFLNKKKTLLEPATENCQDIADSIWNEFLEDALAKIKLAQEAKLEEIRQACTTLNTQCLNDATESINNFDARALSVFGVAADRTVNTMCSDIQKSCSALLNDTLWGEGTHNIATSKTFDTIISSCTQVGRNCIIQSCRSMSSNFGLCNDVNLSLNRHSILTRTSCWNEVLACVASADTDGSAQTVTTNIMELKGLTDFYNEIYGVSRNNLYDICQNECRDVTLETMNTRCAECRIAERIWGNCEKNPNSFAEENKIISPPETSTYETLMSWFATNTNTKDSSKSCTITRCNGQIVHMNDTGTTVCITGENENITTLDNMLCPTGNGTSMLVYNDGDTPRTNCCLGSDRLINQSNTDPQTGVCCMANASNSDTCLPNNINSTELFRANATGNSGTYRLICVGDSDNNLVTGTNNNIGGNNNNLYPSGRRVECHGTLVLVKPNNQYTWVWPRYPLQRNQQNFNGVPYVEDAPTYRPLSYYRKDDANHQIERIYRYGAPGAPGTQPHDDDIKSWFIEYEQWDYDPVPSY